MWTISCTLSGLERAKDFDWDVFRDRLLPMTEDAINAYETRRSDAEEENQGTQSIQEEEVGLREVGTTSSPTESSDFSEGQGEVVDSEEATYQSWPKA